MRFEIGEGEEEERLRANLVQQQQVVEKIHAALDKAQAKRDQIQAEIDAFEQARRVEASLHQFPGSDE